MRKKIDKRIRTLIENGIKNRERTMFVLVGDKGKDQVPPKVSTHLINISKSRLRFFRLVIGCEFALHPLPEHGEEAAFRIMVLQERIGIQYSSKEENESD